MVTHTFVDIDIDEARCLADFTGIECDIRSAIKFSKLLIKCFESSGCDIDLIDAISTSILVRYSRAFMTGVRTRINIEEICLDQNELKKHKWLLDTRSKHIAHSINAFEENRVVGYYVLEKPEEKGITSISVQHGSVISLSSHDAKSVINISTKILEFVTKKIDKEKSRILSIVRQSDIKKFLQHGKQSAFNPNMNKPDKRRK
ncbi:hypothetical protein SCALIN_C16_0034 [Candidatus Scalindua japonica]|uniref:Uncharacterized protein n=1 Tax=Candidatus Scalindua japonica TaxID=1284222 RepID=A0A286TYK7_9BACT|nr:hypothetical protein [Candidatus Scalindua japonica]GAX60960.1 hypothetical protein SCALIN_C16_0034 [Candidatus Scalindua japonica]